MYPPPSGGRPGYQDTPVYIPYQRGVLKRGGFSLPPLKYPPSPPKRLDLYYRATLPLVGGIVERRVSLSCRIARLLYYEPISDPWIV